MKYLFGLYLLFSVFFSSLVMLVYQNSNYIFFRSADLTTISLAFHDDVNLSFVEDTVSEIKKKYGYTNIKIHSPVDQYDTFIKSFSMYSQGAFDTDEILKLIPYTIDIILPDSETAAHVKKTLLSEYSFKDNSTASEWLDKLRSIATLLDSLGRFLFLFLFASTALMTGATIRILISQEDLKNKIHSYLGEPIGSIFKRYLISVGLFYLAAVGLGLLLNFLIYELLVLKIKLNPQFSFFAERLQYLSAHSIALMLAGFFAAFCCGMVFSFRHLMGQIYAED